MNLMINPMMHLLRHRLTCPRIVGLTYGGLICVVFSFAPLFHLFPLLPLESSIGQELGNTESVDRGTAPISTPDDLPRDLNIAQPQPSVIDETPPSLLTTAEGLKESILGEPQLTMGHVVQVIIITAIILTGYSLVMSGRRGNGWQIILFFAVAVSMLGKFFLSLFNEVTSNNETSDWEDD